MGSATDKTFPLRDEPRTGWLQEETEHTGASSQSSAFNSYSTGGQFNAPGGAVNKSTGSGNHFPGSTFNGPVHFGNEKHFDPLQECLKSLAFPEMDSRSNDIDTAAQGTCEWLLQHKMYTSWASCERGLLWIRGKPGSGKSTLLRYALKHVMSMPNTGEGALTLSFFFHGRGSELQKTPLGLFRSLLYQLLCQAPEALTDLVDIFHQRCKTVGKPGEKWQWHPRELLKFFESSLRKVLETRPVRLSVDALDECGQKNAVNLVREFKSLLQGLPSSGSQFRICFTCRHYPILDLDGVFEVCVEKENREDISTFVQDKLSSFHERTPSTIPDLIIEHADGVFLWAWLVVNQVLELELEGIGLKMIEDKICQVPQKLDTLYRQLIQSMSPDSLKAIQWICFATRPLLLDELRWAMLVDADCSHKSLQECKTMKDYISDSDRMKRRVQTLSCGLAEVTSDTKVVQFIHQSVKDFFIEKGLSALDESANTDFGVGIAHHQLSRTCIRYLAMEEIGRSASDDPYYLRSKFPFLHYATTSWVAHMKQSDNRSVPQADLLEYFARPSNTLMELWVRVYRILEKYSYDCPPERTSLLHIMSRYGVAGALRAILKMADQSGININAKDSYGRTPLSWAAEGGHEVVIKLLLKTGKFNVARWPKAVVWLLLLAAGNTDIDTKDGNGWTPLHWAAEKGHEPVVRQLLDRGAHTEPADREGRTPLWIAVENGHEPVVRLLLERGANTEAADKEGQTPLAWAAAQGHEAVGRLLLERGAHTEATDRWGQTPLAWAATRGHEAIMRLFLDYGANIEVTNTEGRTLLFNAAARGHEAIVRMLLNRGAYIEATDTEGRTPLWVAAEKGHESVIQLLLERGANTKAADKEGHTPLAWAAAQGHEAVVRLLLDRGGHTESADTMWGLTPLAWAAARGHEAVVRLLLDRGAHTEAADKMGRTPLVRAAVRGHEAVVRLLLDRGAHTEAADKGGRTPLAWAAARGQEAIVRLLQVHIAQPSSTTLP